VAPSRTNGVSNRAASRLAAGGLVLATTAATSPALAAHDNGDGARALTGGWFLDRQDTVSGNVRGVITFSAGGTVHYQDIFPASLVVLTGSWAGSGRKFRFEMWAGSAEDPATNRPAITIRIKGTLNLTQRGFTSPYSATWFDPATGAELFRFDGSADGTRIEP
jgi:hypothetical protein